MNPRNQRIAAAFAAAEDYDSAAAVQRRVAERLAAMICADPPAAGGLRVEIGCGTGFLTAPLLDRLGGEWLVTDLAPAMVERCAAAVGRHRAAFRIMDGEAPDLAPGSCRLIASSLAFQWFEDVEGALARLAGCLESGGRLCFATLGEDTFAEWRAAHRAEGLPCGAHFFPSRERLVALLPGGGSGTVREECVTATYPDGRAFTRSLKSLGAHLPAAGHRPLSPGDFRRVLRHFAHGCEASYHVLYGTWMKEAS